MPIPRVFEAYGFVVDMCYVIGEDGKVVNVCYDITHS